MNLDDFAHELFPQAQCFPNEGIEDAVERIKAAIASRFCAPEQWISVEERLPEKSDDYLVVVNMGNNTIFVTKCVYYTTAQEAEEDGENDRKGFAVFDDNITHWMPLPEAPVAKNGGIA